MEEAITISQRRSYLHLSASSLHKSAPEVPPFVGVIIAQVSTGGASICRHHHCTSQHDERDWFVVSGVEMDELVGTKEGGQQWLLVPYPRTPWGQLATA
jgi:hypothetical protein